MTRILPNYKSGKKWSFCDFAGNTEPGWMSLVKGFACYRNYKFESWN